MKSVLMQRLAFVLGVSFLCFVWGVLATSNKIFPYRQIQRIQSGYDSWMKMEDTKVPQHVIGAAEGATEIDPVQTLTATPADDLILMTGGFYFRQDLCPTFGCMAFVMDRSGKILHQWEFDPEKVFTAGDFKGFTGQPDAKNLNVQGIDLDADGNLVVVFQGRNIFPYQVGIAKFSWGGQLLWSRVDLSHHWPKVGPDGRIYTPIAHISRDEKTVAATSQEQTCKNGAIFQEGVQVLDPDGQQLKLFWMDDVVRASDMQGLAYSVRNDCDPYHVNGVDLLNDKAAAGIPGARAGDLLVSLRASSALVVLDQDSGKILKIVDGPMVAQHSPRVMADGRFAVFDNLGGIDTQKGTRVLAVDPVSGAHQTIFPTHDDQSGSNLVSDAQGEINFSPDNARVLVSETLGGRVFEVDVASGTVLWSYASISDMAPYFALIGEAGNGPRYMRMQTQGARYLSQTDFDRF